MDWFKAHHDALSDKKLKRIAREIDKPFIEVYGWWMGLLSLASESPERGKLLLTPTEPITAEDIAETFHVTLHETTVTLQSVSQAGLLAFRDGVYVVVNWEKRQYKVDSSTERVRKWREKRATDVTFLERCSNVPETRQSTEYRDKSTHVPPISPKPKTNGHDPDFETWWAAYPKKRAKPDAEKSWKKNSPKRPSLEDMLKALDWQRASYDWTKDNGQFVPNPTTYLNQGRWTDEPTTGTSGGAVLRPLYGFEQNQGAGAGAEAGAVTDPGGEDEGFFDDFDVAEKAF